jgi:hypothetical protein
MTSQLTETERKARIDAFFLAPNKKTPDGDKSVLYLVRRELQDCLIGKVVTERRFLAQERRRRLFASAMVTFSGIDLLARLVSDARPRERFVRFLLRFGKNEDRSLTKPEAEILWSFRNALMHSFGLHHVENGKHVPLWLFQQTDRAPVVHKCHLSNGGYGWELSLDDLVESFCCSSTITRRRSGLTQGFNRHSSRPWTRTERSTTEDFTSRGARRQHRETARPVRRFAVPSGRLVARDR